LNSNKLIEREAALRWRSGDVGLGGGGGRGSVATATTTVKKQNTQKKRRRQMMGRRLKTKNDDCDVTNKQK